MTDLGLVLLPRVFSDKIRVQDQTRGVLTLGSHSGGTQKGHGGRQSDSETGGLPRAWVNACLGLYLLLYSDSINWQTWRSKYVVFLALVHVQPGRVCTASILCIISPKVPLEGLFGT